MTPLSIVSTNAHAIYASAFSIDRKENSISKHYVFKDRCTFRPADYPDCLVIVKHNSVSLLYPKKNIRYSGNAYKSVNKEVAHLNSLNMKNN